MAACMGWVDAGGKETRVGVLLYVRHCRCMHSNGAGDETVGFVFDVGSICVEFAGGL